MLNGVVLVVFRILFKYVSYSGLITYVGEEAIGYSYVVSFDEFPLLLGASDRLRYFIVTLPGSSILFFFSVLCY